MHVAGTLRYMSPEQVSGGPLTRRSDVFSLGCSLFEFLTYEPAYTGTAPELISRIAYGPVTGPGGTGKTRLGLAAARELLPDFRDGVWFVALAPVRDPELVAPTVAAALDIEESGADSLGAALRAHLRECECLLVLDNFEQLTGAAPVVADLLAAAPGLKVLVTSRAVLRLSGEHDYPVPPLPLPSAAAADDADALLHNEAVALFVQRARAVRPGFALERHARAVVDVCIALDGLPLALELAAARVQVLSPEALRDRLERRLPLLDRGPADLPARQRTMRATIDWSYDLLGDEERELFARLAVFAGGCTVEAAEAVCDAELGRLESLVGMSLLRERPGAGGEPRFAMLETVREYAAERLEEGGEAEAMRRRHAEHYAGLVERAEPEMTGAEAAHWLERLDAEHDNIRAALAWSGAAGGRDIELRLAASMHYFWRLRGHLTEARRWLEPALSRDGAAPAGVRARALTALSAVVDRQGEHERCVRLLEEALDLFREEGDDRRAARTLSELGGAAAIMGDLDRAAALFEETLPIFRAAEDQRAQMVTLSNLAAVANLRGDYERGRRLNEEALSLARAAGDLDQTIISLHNLGRAALAQNGGDEARRFFDESLRLGFELGYRELVATCLEGLAELACREGDLGRSARLLGAAEAVLTDMGVHLGPEEQEGYESTLATLSATLGADRLDTLRAEGAALPLDDAVALALRD